MSDCLPRTLPCDSAMRGRERAGDFLQSQSLACTVVASGVRRLSFRRQANRREKQASWQGDPMWGPYWGPTGSGVYEAEIVWEEDAVQQKQESEAASSHLQAEAERTSFSGDALVGCV